MIDYVKKLREKADLLEKSGYATCGLVQDYRNCAKIIEKLSEQPQADKWIPCEERLPECEWGYETKALMFQMKDTDTIKVGYYGEGGKYRDRYFRTYTDAFEGVDAKDVIAWRPLPDTYKKDGETND